MAALQLEQGSHLILKKKKKIGFPLSLLAVCWKNFASKNEGLLMVF